jgi:hypothetical protein
VTLINQLLDGKAGDSGALLFALRLRRRRRFRHHRPLESKAGGFEAVEELQVLLAANAGRQAVEERLKIAVAEHRAVIVVHGVAPSRKNRVLRGDPDQGRIRARPQGGVVEGEGSVAPASVLVCGASAVRGGWVRSCWATA